VATTIAGRINKRSVTNRRRKLTGINNTKTVQCCRGSEDRDICQYARSDVAKLGHAKWKHEIFARTAIVEEHKAVDTRRHDGQWYDLQYGGGDVEWKLLRFPVQ
jgi:hypothetical protein